MTNSLRRLRRFDGDVSLLALPPAVEETFRSAGVFPFFEHYREERGARQACRLKRLAMAGGRLGISRSWSGGWGPPPTRGDSTGSSVIWGSRRCRSRILVGGLASAWRGLWLCEWTGTVGG